MSAFNDPGQLARRPAARRPQSRCLSASLLLVLIGPVASAQASGGELVTHLALLELQIDDVHDDLASRLGVALRREVLARPGHSLSDARVSLEQLSLVHDCEAGQTSCLGLIAHQLGVSGLIYGQLENEGRGAYCELKLFDVATQSVKRTARTMFALREVSGADLDRKAAELIEQLLAAAAVAPTEAPPLAPGAVPEPSLGETSGGDGLSGKRVAGYALLGGAALSVGLSVLAFVEIDRSENNQSYDRYRRTIGSTDPKVEDVCDEAAADHSHGLDASSFSEVKSECTTGRTYEVLQFVFLGAAAISGGLSAYFLLSEDGTPERKTALQALPVQPIIRGNSAELRARFAF